jgi:Flp pilus assembly pilin Flp
MWAGTKRADFEGMSLSYWRREEGQTMSEYVVVLAIITPAVLLSFGLFSDAVVSTYDAVRSFLS